MSVAQYETGEIVLAAVTSPVSITSLYVLKNDTHFPTKWGIAPANGGSASGTPVLHMYFEWDGTDGARYTLDGTTTPDNDTGFLVIQDDAIGVAGSSTELILRGQDAITNLQTIAIAGAGVSVTWIITVDDDR